LISIAALTETFVDACFHQYTSATVGIYFHHQHNTVSYAHNGKRRESWQFSVHKPGIRQELNVVLDRDAQPPWNGSCILDTKRQRQKEHKHTLFLPDVTVSSAEKALIHRRKAAGIDEPPPKAFNSTLPQPCVLTPRSMMAKQQLARLQQMQDVRDISYKQMQRKEDLRIMYNKIPDSETAYQALLKVAQ
jgi:hypothetical protein